MTPDGLAELWDFIRALDKRLSVLEERHKTLRGEVSSVDEKVNCAAQHSIGVDADLVEVKKYLCERRKARQKWAEDMRWLTRHVIGWGTPILLLWMIVIFSGGFRIWVRAWLAS